jgi:hypothetical protein
MRTITPQAISVTRHANGSGSAVIHCPGPQATQFIAIDSYGIALCRLSGDQALTLGELACLLGMWFLDAPGPIKGHQQFVTQPSGAKRAVYSASIEGPAGQLLHIHNNGMLTLGSESLPASALPRLLADWFADARPNYFEAG